MKLAGRVLIKETNQGIPNLLVVAYDAAGDTAAQVLKAAADGRGSDAFGRRIASLVTDEEGAFSISGDALGCSGHEPRPNLLLVVFAPEDVQSAARPYPLPPEKRVLYLSAVPRTAAGAEEAFVIRVLQEQIAHFGIYQPSGIPTTDVSVTRLYSATTQAIALREGLRATLGPHLQKEQERANQTKKLAAEKVKALSGVPKHLRDGKLQNNRFLLMHRNELAPRLKAVQDDAIIDGLKRARKVTTTLRLRVSAQDLQDLGLKNGGAQASRQVDHKKVLAKVKELLGGVDLVRRAAPSNALADRLEAKYLRTPSTREEQKPAAPQEGARTDGKRRPMKSAHRERSHA
jgi:hypothetical protein